MEAEGGYHYSAIRGFTLSALFWLVIGLVVGLWISAELFMPGLNLTSWLGYGRLRVIHVNALAFGFGLGAIFGMHLLHPAAARPRAACLPQAGAVAALALQRRHRAGARSRCSWATPVARVRRAGMAARHRRRHPLGDVRGERVRDHPGQAQEEQMYISLWYIIATVVARGGALHRATTSSIPVGLFKSYHLFAGVNSRQRRVVVRPQRGGLRLHHAHPGDVLLLPPQVDRAAHLQPPALHRGLLVAGLRLPLDRRAPPRLHAAARLDPDRSASSSPSS